MSYSEEHHTGSRGHVRDGSECWCESDKRTAQEEA